MARNIYAGLVGIFMIIMLVFSGCVPPQGLPNNNNNNTSNNGNTSDIDLEVAEDLKVFSSKQELADFLKEQELEESYYYSNSRSFGASDMAVAESASVQTKGVASAEFDSSSGSGASDYSQTNVQVEGVDEADIVKNDGKYIYTISQNRVLIVDAYPAEDAEVLSEIEYDERETPVNMFINGDKLVVFTNKYEEVEAVSSYNFLPYKSYKDFTHVYIYDISNRKDPNEVKDFSISGGYENARMIGDNVYLVSREYVNYYRGNLEVPVIYDNGIKVVEPKIYYFDMPHYSYNFNTLSSFNVDTLEQVDSKSFMLGYGTTMYVSENNIYIAYSKYYETNRIVDFMETIYTVLPSDVQSKIDDILDEKATDDYYFQKIVTVLEEMYNDMDENEKENLIEDISEIQEEYYYKREAERSKTIIHKIMIDNGKIDYDTKGEVLGHLLNQFSLDEHKGNLRVATTTSFWTRKGGSVSYNNVYVLDDNMEQIGELEKLAEDESIYSTRFMGDKLYMVTFRQVDPLFVIDLSNPEAPEVLGKLKVPGFSQYLHPYDENFLIGVGKDTKESEWGGIVTTGVKVSLFDVSDFENPKEVDTYVIEGRWSDSVALYDHKAFLFDKDKELMVIPVREYIGEENSYKYEYVQGAYVFTVTEEGFDLRGTIVHDDFEEGYSYWYSSPSEVKRSLYMDNVLYTISERMILANDIETLDEINEVDLGYKEVRREYPIYYDNVGGVGITEPAVEEKTEIME